MLNFLVQFAILFIQVLPVQTERVVLAIFRFISMCWADVARVHTEEGMILAAITYMCIMP